jgi:DNA-binding PadR family transcriptional regulator
MTENVTVTDKRDVSDTGDRFLPLGAPVFHVLLALGQDALHGYGILEAIEAKTQGRASILPGTLYATMNRMLDDGLIAEAPRPEGADARRKYYRITDLGRGVVAAESERLQVLLDVARRESLAPPEARPDEA